MNDSFKVTYMHKVVFISKHWFVSFKMINLDSSMFTRKYNLLNAQD